jgi:hypothetical protein
MLSQQEIQKALRGRRVVLLEVPNPHGPLGLEHRAAAVARMAEADREELVIGLPRVRHQTMNAQQGTAPVHRSLV